jgi:hypothetical protein
MNTQFFTTLPYPRRLLFASLALACSSPLIAQTASQQTSGSTGLAASQGGVPVAGPAPRYESNPILDDGTLSTGAPDVHGTFSVENFQGTQKNLNYTHESADGFRNYLAQWYAPNYIYRDSGVGTWAFTDIINGDNYDKWTYGSIDYGIDAVLTSFQSSHGGMNLTTKVFGTSMGSDWAGRGWTAKSNKMALGGNANSFGDERLRYMFWDTCKSVKWNGMTPLDTWGARAKGVRMIFGYDTNSLDSPYYGQFLWEEWNKNKTLKTAFLDASWRVNHGQSPCMVAFGGSQWEASNRRDTERYMDWGAVSSSWGAWAWYSVGSAPDGGDSGSNRSLTVPRLVTRQALARRGNGDAEVLDTARKLGISIADASLVEDRPFGLRAVHTPDLELMVEADGDFELHFVQDGLAVPASGPVVADDALIGRAEAIVGQFHLAGASAYQASEIRYLNESHGTEGAAASVPVIVEKTVILDQVVDGLPFIDADAGHLEITFDAVDQRVLRVRSSLKPIDAGFGAAPQATRDLSELRQTAIAMASTPPVPGVPADQGVPTIVEGSEAIGYALVDDEPLAVYRVLLADSLYPDGKMQQVLVPLTR